MNFDKIFYLPFILIFLAFYLFIFFKKYKNIQKILNNYFFYKYKMKFIISKIFLALGFILLSISLLDLRANPEKTTAKIPKQKTIILIDTSQSMLAEDVRPNRFEKSLILVRHLVKHLIGHTTSVILFSDSQKKLVPFTSDTDLIDAKVSGLSELRINRGGTNLSTVLMESLAYLRDQDKNYFGNIILFTDAEENEIPVEIKIPDSVSVALIAVGTKEGAKIPIRGQSGMYIGSQRFNGQEVISKIGISTIETFGKKIKNFKYWIAGSYSLPTSEVLSFLKSSHRSKFSDGEMISKPVVGNHLIMLGLLCIGMSILLNMGKNFTRVSLILILTFSLNSQSEEEKKLSEYGEELKLKLQNGEANRSEKLKLAQELLISNFVELSEKIYESEFKKNKLNSIELSNYIVSLFQNKKINEGLILAKKLMSQVEVQENKDIEKIIRTNILIALKQEKQNQQNQKEQNQKDQNNQGSGGNSKDKEKDKNQEKKEEQKENNSNEENKDENKNDKKDEKDQENKDKQENKKEVPALLKQLVNDDKKLQGQKMDTKTYSNERREGVKKNW